MAANNVYTIHDISNDLASSFVPTNVPQQISSTPMHSNKKVVLARTFLEQKFEVNKPSQLITPTAASKRLLMASKTSVQNAQTSKELKVVLVPNTSVQQTTSTATVSNKYVVLTNTSLKNADMNKNLPKVALTDVTNKLSLNRAVQQPGQQTFRAVFQSPVVTNTTLPTPVQQTTSTAVSNKYVVLTNTSLKNVDVNKNLPNKVALTDITNKLSSNRVQQPGQQTLRAVFKSSIVTNDTTYTKPTHSSSDNQSTAPPVFRSNALSAEYIQGKNLPKIIVHQNEVAFNPCLNVLNPSVDGSVTLRKIPNRQKSLSLQKNKTLALALKSNPGLTAPSQQIEVFSDIPTTVVTEDPSEPPSADSSVTETPANLQEILEDMLPSKYSYHISEIEPVKVYHTKDYDESRMFMAVVRVNLRSKDEALEWLTEFTANTSTDWRIRRPFPENTKCIIFKKGYRCQNNTMTQYRKGPVTAHEKHTECSASLMITVKNFNMTRSKDPLLKKYPCEIVIHHCHNHPLEAAANLNHRRPSDEVRRKFEELFRSGFSPSTALHTHQYDLQMKSGDAFFKVLADGLECPSLQWCYNLYRNNFSQAYGAPSGEGMLASLKAAVHKYNAECGSTCAVINVFEETEIVVALCTPLMKRVHQLKSSGEMAFLDAGGMMDRQNNRVFTLLAHSAAGALPEGLIITSSESEDAIYEGLKMLMSVVPPGAFGGRGIRGPQIIMTDDQTSERNALRLIFPEVILLLCLFHVLQAMWRYIWDSKHKVDTSDKLEVYMLFREVTYELDEDEFKKKYGCMLFHSTICKNPILKKHLKGLYDRAPEWALCFRNDLLTRGNNTNNYSEATVRQLKDQVLRRLTAYSEVQLFEFFTTRLETYFERRLANVLNGRQENYYKSKHFVHPSKLIPLQSEKTSQEGFYLVKNVEHKTEYVVDMEHQVCSCPVGRNGAPCKHQMAVVQTFNISSTQFLPVDLESMLALHEVMTTVPPPPEWYASLKEGPFVPNSSTASDNYPEIIDQTSANNNESDENLPVNEPTAEISAYVIFNEEQLSAALKKWEAINSHMVTALTEKPEVFVSAVEKFSKEFEKAKQASENQLVSALHTFNQERISPRSVVRKYIYVNKASMAKRQDAALGGRHVTRQGRPPKSKRTNEHGYNQEVHVKELAWNRVPTKRGAMPHSLSQKVLEQSASKKPRRK